MFRTITRGIALAALSLLLRSTEVHAAVDTVWVYNTEFSINPPGGPIENAVINVGDTIRWVHLQGNHTTTSVMGSTEVWDALITSANPLLQRQFNNPGVFWYYCIPHGTDNMNGTASGMAGTITVLSPGTGGCCMTDGTCMLTSSSVCTGMGGVFQGSGTSCSPNPCSIQPATTTLQALKDNSIYSESGSVSNGGGTSMFVGVRQSNIRRSLIAFDLSGIPMGADITAVELRMVCTTLNTAQSVSLRTLNANWGEGTAVGNLNSGAAAVAGDATWTQRLFNTSNWATAGGDFQATASATTTVSATGTINWSSAALLADVQMWYDMPGMNHGWIISANEVVNNQNVTFASSENGTAANRPQLLVTYIPPGPAGACCLPNNTCASLSEGQCAAQGGTWQGPGSMCATAACPVNLTPYLDPLPLPGVAQPVTGSAGGAAHYNIAMTEQFQQLHSQLPPTRVWGYNGAYPGPTIEAFKGDTVTVVWANDLRVFETNMLRMHHALDVDTCLHGPHETGHAPVAVVHLHGAVVDSESDGQPELAFPPGQQSAVYTYPNQQPAATLWYHDHALGITRLNVMMGLAGFYLLRDELENALGLPAGQYEVPLAIQDRTFNNDGSLQYPEHWHEHFFGDKVLVNGKVWPYFNVQRGKYRFRMLNGSNSRAYTLALSNGATFWQIGTDQALLSAPVALTSLTILPGERADVVIDFEPYAAGTELILTNNAPAPFPGNPGVGVIPNVMKFIVQAATGHTAPLPATLVPVVPFPESEAFVERDFDLILMPNYCPDAMGPMWTINGLMWDDITEEPIQGATEIWRWFNNSGISHPMHMHLEPSQLLDRQAIDANGVPFGPVLPPAANEQGLKDTWDVPTGHVTRVITRFASPHTGLFPYHCHILEHEDHEMMRQMNVLAPIRVAAKAFLEGPYNSTLGLMNDVLRSTNLLPLTEPYTAAGFPLRGGSGTTTTFDVLASTGPDAIVDWVVLELRDPVLDTVLRTRPSLLQRDGDIVGPDGISPVVFDLPAGNYHVSIRHRNHLGCMTSAELALSSTPTAVDFTTLATTTFGTNARKTSAGAVPVQLLWAGDVTSNSQVKYTGSGNDRDPILVTVGSTTPNNVVTNAYSTRDVNLNGNVQYTGSGNDRDPILVNVGSTTPNNVRVEQLP